MIDLLLLLILSHLVADFLLQSNRMAEKKYQSRIKEYLKHAAAHLTVMAVLTHFYFSPDLLFLWLLLPVMHTVQDFIKNRLFSPAHPAEALIFLMDQALHLLIIFLTWQWILPHPGKAVAEFYSNLPAPAGEAVVNMISEQLSLLPVLFTMVVYGYVIFGGAVLVRKVLNIKALGLADAHRKNGDTGTAGRYIGLLERALILTLTLIGEFTSIAFVLTAKSIARYKELEARNFAEYYLVGTLLSSLIAIAGGLLLRFSKVFFI